MNGNLYIVATPIGNLQDISLRAITTLRSVDIIACEDTRRTGILLNELKKIKEIDNEIEKPQLISYYEQNEVKRIPEIISALKNSKNVALVSDGGTPLISDPGFKLVRECVEQGIKVTSIPGPSSVISALVVSGLPTDKFFFVGYLPKKEGHRRKILEKVQKVNNVIASTIIIFESPHKLVGTLNEIKDVLGDIEIVLVREITKIYEEIKKDRTSNLINHFSKTTPKGEFVILFNLKV